MPRVYNYISLFAKVCSEENLYHRYQNLHRQTGQKYAGGHMRSSKINFPIKENIKKILYGKIVI